MTRMIGGLKLPHLLAAALVAVVLGLGVHFLRKSRSEAASARERALVDTVAVAGERMRVVDTIYRADTVRLTQTVTRWRDAKAVVKEIMVHDTVSVPGPVVRVLVEAADSTINACTAALRTCESRVAARDTFWDARLRLNTIQMERRATESLKRGRKQGAVAATVVIIGTAIAVRQVAP